MYVCVANLKNKIASYFTSKKEYRQEWQGNCNSGHASYGKALASTENKGKEGLPKAGSGVGMEDAELGSYW